MRSAVIVSAVRTAVGKAPRGALHTMRPDDMAAVAINAAIERAGIEFNLDSVGGARVKLSRGSPLLGNVLHTRGVALHAPEQQDFPSLLSVILA